MGNSSDAPVVVEGFSLLKAGSGPEIKTQPQSKAVQVGQSVSLTVEMADPTDASLSYAWYKSGGAVSSGSSTLLGSSSSYTIGSAKSEDTGFYSVIVTGTSGMVQSIPALVFVNLSNPTGTPEDAAERKKVQDLQTLVASEGETVFLRTFAVGDGLRYTWTRSNGTIPATSKGANTSVLALRGVKPEDSGVYSASITLADGTTFADPVSWTVYVAPVPQILGQPFSQSYLPGDKAVLSAEVKVTNDTRFQWYFRPNEDSGWSQVPGGSLSNNFVIPAIKSVDSGQYRLEISNSAGTVSSEIANIRVWDPVVIDGAPVVSLDGGAVQAVNPGRNPTLTVHFHGDAADGNPVQWYRYDPKTRFWNVINGANAESLVLNSVTEADDTLYKAKVIAKVNGVVESPTVRLVVNDSVAFATTARLQTLSLVAGEPAAFIAPVTGYLPEFRWYYRKDASRAWTPLAGETSSALSIRSVTMENDGYYGVCVFNDFSKAGSSRLSPEDPFVLGRIIVHEPPKIEGSAIAAAGVFRSSSAGLVVIDESKGFSLSAIIPSGTAVPVTYQWRRDGVAVSSGSILALPETVTCSVSAASKDTSGRYDLVISNVYGVSVSAPLNVLVNTWPVITSSPSDTTVVEGSSASFRVDADGEGVTFVWETSKSKDGPFTRFQYPTGEKPSGRLLTLVDLTESDALNGSYFRALASNSAGFDELKGTSRAAKLVVTSANDLAAEAPVFSGPVSNGVTRPGAKDVSISVKATGSGEITYQWRKNGAAIPGAIHNTYLLPEINNDSGGLYDVVVSNGANFVYTSPLSLAVEPHIDSLFIPSSANPGDGVRMEVKANASSAISYRWYRKDVGAADSSRAELKNIQGSVSGATSAVLVFEGVKLSDDAEYQVEVSAAGASQTTPFQRMNVISKVVISGQPVSQTRTQGDAGVQMTVQASGDGVLQYRWLRDGVPVNSGNGVSGATTATIQFSNLDLEHAGSYQAEVSNSAGAVLSTAAYLQVLPNFGVSIKNPGRVTLGSGASLVASIVGAQSASYKWYRGSGDGAVLIAGGTAAQLNLNPVLSTDAGVYTVEAFEVGGRNRRATGTVNLQLSRVLELVVPLSSQTVAPGKPALFGVVVKYDQALRYRWYRGTGASKTVLDGATTDKYVIRSVADPVDFSTYTVRVTASTDPGAFDDPSLYVESSAKLNKQLSTGAGSVTGSGSAGTVSATNFSRWWVFWVDASKALDDAAPHKTGYWVLERKQERDASGALVAVTTGRSAWVWTDAASPVEWTPSEQQVQDASANIKSEFSVVASRATAGVDSFILNGTVETGTDAAWVGAPVLLSGSYDASDSESFTLEMSWDGDKAASAQIYADSEWNDVLSFLKSALTHQNDVPAGD